MKPSVGRIVHYVSYGTPGGEYKSVCRAAVITEVDGFGAVPEGDVPCIGLCVLNPEGQFFNRGVRQADADSLSGWYPGGTWHWPERVE